jgi:hypothetical protein
MQPYILTIPTLQLHDHEETYIMPKKIDVQVKSDDFFALLASRIDSLNQAIVAQHAACQQTITPELQSIVDDLLYLQEHYTITKK